MQKVYFENNLISVRFVWSRKHIFVLLKEEALLNWRRKNKVLRVLLIEAIKDLSYSFIDNCLQREQQLMCT